MHWPTCALRSTRRIGQLSRYMADQGVRMAFHHHMGTVVERATEVDRLMEGTPDTVGLLYDTGHLTFAGDDPAQVARKWARRINHVHAKDVRPDVLARVHKERLSFLDAVVEGVYTVPGDGCVDFSEVGRFLRQSGYRGWAVVEAEQDPAKATPKVYAAKAFDYVKNLLVS